MLKTGLAVFVLGALALGGYFYLADTSERSRSEKAKQAALDVGDAVRDKGVAGMVDARLKLKFGLDATRFLHAYYDEGRVVLYGLVPEGTDEQALVNEAAQVPGVKTVEPLVETRPEYIAPLKPITKDASPEPQPAEPAESPTP
jgi:osmotically-inducible protein OsmY